MRSIFAALMLVLVTAAGAVRADSEPAPSPDLTPQDVVGIVVKALRDNDKSGSDEGIATVFRFASPDNRSTTGPLARFTRMIKVGFSDMLTHVSSRYDAMTIEADKALQAVWLMAPSGEEVGYAFQLGRQAGGEFDGMWMTESVLPLGKGAQSGIRI